MDTVDWGRIAPPFEFHIEEEVDDFSEIVLHAHEMVCKLGSCFNADSSGPRRDSSLGKIRSVIENAFVGIVGYGPKDRFKDIFDQVSYFTSHLALDHIFADGNKRTALLMGLVICKAFGNVELELQDNPDPRQNELYVWIGDVVSRKKSESELADVLRAIAIPKADE